MALSNDKPKETVSVYQLLLEITQRLRELQEDPEALDKAAKAAFELPAYEAAKAQESRDSIAQYQSLVDEHKKLLNDLSASHASLDEKKRDIASSFGAIDEKNLQLRAREKELAQEIAKLEALQRAVANAQSNLVAGEQKLARDNEALSARKQEIDAYEAGLKAKAAQLQKLAEGL